MKYRIPGKASNLRLLIISVFVLVMTSCEKEVHINLGTSAAKVVIQGAIENGKVPYVILTSTISFFSNVDLATLQNSFLHDAVITVSDGTKTTTLKEYSIDTGANNKVYIYSVDTSGSTGFMTGEIGKFYTLSVIYGGTTYTSVTKIPNPAGVDTMWFDKPEFVNDKTPATARQMFINYTDPDTSGNYVRCFTRRGNQLFYPSGIFSDEVVNGKVVNKIGILGGYAASSGTDNRNRDSLVYFFPGETVTLQWSSIDKGVYTFWNSVDFAKNAVGNPFSSPINTISNISNGAVGVWSGYGSVYVTMVVPN